MKLGPETAARLRQELDFYGLRGLSLGIKVHGRRLVNENGKRLDPDEASRALNFLGYLRKAVEARRRALINVPRLRDDMALVRQHGGEFFCTVMDDGRIVDDHGRELEFEEIGEFVHAVAAERASIARDSREPGAAH